MNEISVNRKAALEFLSNIKLTNEDKNNKNNNNNKTKRTKSNQEISRTNQLIDNNSSDKEEIDIPPDPPTFEEKERISKSSNSPKLNKKPGRKIIQSKKDKAATLFLSNIQLSFENEEEMTIISSPVSIPNSNNDDDNYFSNIQSKELRINSIEKGHYSSSSSDSDDENNTESRKDSESEDEIPILGTSKRSSYLSDKGNFKEMNATLSTNLETVFADKFYESPSKLKLNNPQDQFRIRNNKNQNKIKNKKNRPDSYMYLLNPKDTLKPDAITDYNPLGLDDPNQEIEVKSSGFRDLMDSLFLFTKSSDIDDNDDTFFISHPTVDPSLTLSQIRSCKSKMLELAEFMDLEYSSVAIAYVYFEKLCLKGLVNKDNRKLKAASCLFLAVKVNEHKNQLNGIMDAFDKFFDLDDKEIRSVEFLTFAELEFSLNIPKNEFLPHLERILDEKKIESIDDYVQWKNFYL